jgi:hypothetical protein
MIKSKSQGTVIFTFEYLPIYPCFQDIRFISQDFGRDPPSVLADFAVEKGLGLGRIGGNEKININR